MEVDEEQGNEPAALQGTSQAIERVRRFVFHGIRSGLTLRSLLGAIRDKRSAVQPRCVRYVDSNVDRIAGSLTGRNSGAQACLFNLLCSSRGAPLLHSPTRVVVSPPLEVWAPLLHHLLLRRPRKIKETLPAALQLRGHPSHQPLLIPPPRVPCHSRSATPRLAHLFPRAERLQVTPSLRHYIGWRLKSKSSGRLWVHKTR